MIWLSQCEEEVMAVFLLSSLCAEGPKCKTCEELYNISLPLDLGTDHVNFLNGLSLLNQVFWSLLHHVTVCCCLVSLC